MIFDAPSVTDPVALEGTRWAVFRILQIHMHLAGSASDLSTSSRVDADEDMRRARLSGIVNEDNSVTTGTEHE